MKNFISLLFKYPRKLNIGSGATKFVNWIPSDIDDLNITIEKDWKKNLFFLKLDNIMAEHVWEHLTDADTVLANQNCYKYLKKGGVLRIAVPDGYNPNKEYIEHVKPAGMGPGAEDHKILYTYKIMSERLQKVGFKVNLLEYWDEKGEFHFIDWTDNNGHIKRSRRYDPRNQNGKLVYTSLIIDAIKE